jgi:hypothetical protein
MNRADGFSPGSMLITKVPGLHNLAAARRSKLPPIGNLRRSLARRSPVVVINARTGSATRSGRRSTSTRRVRAVAC